MEEAKRVPMRVAFTEVGDQLENELKKDQIDKVTVLTLLSNLENKGQRLFKIDEQVMDDMLFPTKADQGRIDLEFKTSEAYRDRLCALRTEVEEFVTLKNAATESLKGTSEISSNRNFKLPKLEWKKFSGDPKDWLGFWGQFQKIDDNKDIDGADKFPYLLQAVEKDSRAGELVDSFPPSATCYPKAIDSLKNRFGREDILVEVYVRELLKLVLQNALNSKQKIVLSSLYDKLETYLRALESLNVTSDKYAAMLYPLVESCLPEDVMRAWERSRVQLTSASTVGGSQVNQLTLLMSFLRTEVEGEERILMARKGFGLEKDEKPRKARQKQEDICSDVPTAAGLFSGHNESKKKKSVCIFCGKDNHSCYMCRSAKQMSYEEKRKIVSEKNCCLSCLMPGHWAKDCRSTYKCKRCDKKHATIMCNQQSSSKDESNNSDGKETKSNVLANQTCTSEVLMQTLMVRLLHEGKEIVVRAVMDSGSQRSYIREDAARALGYPSQGEEQVQHNLFGGAMSKSRVHKKYQINVSSMDRKYRCTFAVLDETEICGNLPKAKSGPWMQELQKLKIPLADCGGDCPEIQLLLGVDVCKKLETGKKYDFACGPSAVETHLGWTLCGKTFEAKSDSTLLVTTMFVKNAELQDLWKLDTIGITDPAESKTRDELQQAAMDYFLKTVTREPDGRYEVSLPWISGHGELASNRFLAEKRLQSATKKIQSEEVMTEYQKIFDTWEDQGIIEEVPIEEVSNFGHYLPHRAVLKPNSETTPVRPVYDASAKEKFSFSLNDCLEKGPNLLELVPDVMTRFRLKKFGVVSDIEKAFLQIGLRKADRDFLRFLWWEDSKLSETIKEYRHRRVVFGVSSSPFLLGATINFHLDQAPSHLKNTAKKLKSSFYVDNCVTSLSSQQEVKIFQKEATELMSTAKFNLRGWITSCASEQKTYPVLGFTWNLENDSLSCDARGLSPDIKPPITKRKILSAAHGIFDPIGFSCPVTLFPKKLLQEIWGLKLEWDQELPESLSRKFEKWLEMLPLLKQVKIPRWLFEFECAEESKSLHVFVDASKEAYAACVFMRGEHENGVSVQLVLAKTRVAPVKNVSIPRLELLACCIGARLAHSAKKILERMDIPTRYWTDSSNALCWIRKDEQWATFVANRVREIRTLSDYTMWNHIPGSHNPADLPSRGCTSKQLLESAWWEGPGWLKDSEELWPRSKFVPNEDVVNAEKRKTVAAHLGFPAKDCFSEELTKTFLNFRRILKTVAYIRRFSYNCKKKKINAHERKAGPLDVQELEDAEMSLVKLIQSEAFGKDEDIAKGIIVSKDGSGIYRVETKIRYRKDTKNFTNPIVLPANHELVKLMIKAKHIEMCHAGVQTVQCTLREKFWIVRAKKTIRDVIRKCVKCRRFDAQRLETVSAPLPVDRVRDAAVFEVTGVDLAGPLFLKGGQKTWIVLFTCAIYRAVHLELVTALSTEAFLQAFRRFVSRRGRPTTIYSDNGTNFVGAVNLFRGLDWKLVEETAAIQRIQWKFIPPTGAWWGGFWERLVQSVKRLLRRVLGRAALTYEELLTVLCDCENVVNSRPLTYVSEDIEDLVPLTPLMFLQEVKECSVADVDFLDGRGLNRRANYLQKLREDLRKRFRAEYLGMLVGAETKKRTEAIRPGEIVLIGDDRSKRIDWILAVVKEVIPGRDGVVRVAHLKTAKGDVTRPVQRLYPLEVSVDDRKEIVKLNPEISQGKPDVVTRSGRKVKTPLKFGI